MGVSRRHLREEIMASQDKGAGPEVGQMVLYNYGSTSSPTIAPAIIYAVAAAGTVSLNYFTSGGATNATGAKFDYNLSGSTWAYPQFL